MNYDPFYGKREVIFSQTLIHTENADKLFQLTKQDHSILLKGIVLKYKNRFGKNNCDYHSI